VFLSFLEAMRQLSFTINFWLGQNRQPYLAITAHWISQHKEISALKLKMVLIAFYRICNKHNGLLLANIVLHLLNRADVTRKVL
jgi:hypothetical protein